MTHSPANKRRQGCRDTQALAAGAMPLIARIAAAIFGGYACSAVFCVALARLLPLSKADSTLTAMMSSFVLYAVAVIYAFGAASVWRVWGLLAGLPLLCYVLLQLLG
ncbi:hypothetical protein LZP73_10270 [Shewanella sp. AS16]|uniref:hypothetical protein n=1 Tax=Shewanella sp. AS16 TaxID=2907625 RepID=UPI001F32B609|nr:hypothetical protein [Shewanella sp. AS16]MCE9686590.1 hypothetical protein [Shewanella sp. AS16]